MRPNNGNKRHPKRLNFVVAHGVGPLNSIVVNGVFNKTHCYPSIISHGIGISFLSKERPIKRTWKGLTWNGRTHFARKMKSSRMNTSGKKTAQGTHGQKMDTHKDARVEECKQGRVIKGRTRGKDARTRINALSARVE